MGGGALIASNQPPQGKLGAFDLWDPAAEKCPLFPLATRGTGRGEKQAASNFTPTLPDSKDNLFSRPDRI